MYAFLGTKDAVHDCRRFGYEPCSFILAWAGTIGQWSSHLISYSDAGKAAWTITMAVALLSVLLLSLAVQPLQCAYRAIVLGLLPSAQQIRAQSWTAILINTGQLLGCIAGLKYVPKSDPLG